MRRFLLLICLISLCSICIAAPNNTPTQEIPAAWQTSPSDKHTMCTVSEKPSDLTLSWKLDKTVPKGSWVRVRSTGLHCLGQFEISSLTAAVKKRTLEIPITNRFTREAQNKDWMFFVFNPYLVAGQLESELPKGTNVTAKGEFVKYLVSGNHFNFRIETASDWKGPWSPVSAWNIISTEAAEAKSMEAYYRADGRLNVLYLDAYTNPANPGSRQLKICDPDGKELFSVDVKDTSSVEIPLGKVPESLERVLVKDDKGLQALSTARPKHSIGGYKTYFGEFHFHTEFSGDGHRPLRESLDSARDQLGLDFASPGDHMPFSGGYKLDEYLDILDSYNKPGNYVTLLGYELSLGQGHINPYYRNRKTAAKFSEAWADLQSNPENVKPNMLKQSVFLSHFAPEEMIAIPHHTNTTSGPIVNAKGLAMWRNFDWRVADDRYNRAVEINQGRGSFECEQPEGDWRIYDGGFGSSVRTALARGLRLGIVGGTDNHHGWPTRLMGQPGYCSLTGIQAPELTREAIFDAIRARRTYATSGPRIALDFVLNDQYPMGSEVKFSPKTKRNFKITVRGTAPVDKAEVISQGMTLAKLETNGKSDLDITWTDPRPNAPIDDCYYYLRIHQTDGHCAWSSPIWIDYQE